MASPPDSTSDLPSRFDKGRGDHSVYKTRVGLTQGLAKGLVAFTFLMVLLAIVINFILGSPRE